MPPSRQLVGLVFLFLIGYGELAGNALSSTHLLLTARNGTKGVEVQLFHDADQRQFSDYEQREITGRYLSPECGDSFRRCSQMTVVAAADFATASAPAASRDEGEAFIAILPLDRALALLKFSVGHLSDSKVHFIDFTNCSPGQIIRIERGDYYVVCSNTSLGFVTLLKLNLDTENIAESLIPELDYPHLQVRNVTNFLHVDLPLKTGHYIYLAAGYTLFYIIPYDFIVGRIDIGLENRRCVAKELGYTADWEMIVYCNDSRAMYVDIKSEYIWHVSDYAEEGRPYICPDRDVYIGVFSEAGFIQYGNRSTLAAKNFDAPVSSYDNGVCLGSPDTTLFVFTDREMGTRLLNTNPSEGSITSLSDSTCVNYPCLPLVVLEDRFLVLREKRQGDWHISLFDSHHNFSVILEAPHNQADVVAVIAHDIPSSASTVTALPKNGVTTRENTSARSNNSNAQSKLFGFIAVIPAVIFISVVALLWFVKQRRGRRDYITKPIDEEGQAIQERG
jgi:hypothetical protein